MSRQFWIVFLLVGLTLGDDGPPPASQRPTRTIARFFGFDSGSSNQQPPQQVVVPPSQGAQYRKPVVPLIYSVKYYDRTSTVGENGDKVDVQEQSVVNGKVQPTPARVFLNLYSGQGSPVYYDNKGQVLVPCPIYDHVYFTDSGPVSGVRTQQQQVIPVPVPQASVPQQQQTQQVVPGKVKQPQQQSVSQQVVPPVVVYPQPAPVGQEFVYYGTPTSVSGQDGVRFVVGFPYDYPFVYSGVHHPSPVGYYPGQYSPYVYVKPPGNGVQGHHHQPFGLVSVVPPVVQQSSVSQSVPVGQGAGGGNSGSGTSVVEKNDGEKAAD